MSSGGGSTTSQTSSKEPPGYAKPYYQNALNMAQNISNQPFTPYNGQRVAGMNQANPYGKNPYTGQLIQQQLQGMRQNYANNTHPNQEAQFNSAGAYGGSAQMQAQARSEGQLAGQMTDAATSMREQDLGNQRNAWYGMLGRQQQNMDAQYGQFKDQRGWQGNRLQFLNGILGSLNGQGTTTGTGPNENYSSAGQNAAGLAALFGSGYQQYQANQSSQPPAYTNQDVGAYWSQGGW